MQSNDPEISFGTLCYSSSGLTSRPEPKAQMFQASAGGPLGLVEPESESGVSAIRAGALCTFVSPTTRSPHEVVGSLNIRIHWCTLKFQKK
ncbi:hypothetical protein TWF730_003570 [Orbilia blumenaviensis]|uniref:Uncharacterized protein n=1 Tax=Orbilia blumenaviensis TaxID=1796055 RepID=A0AAV9U2U3_9PEZI